MLKIQGKKYAVIHVVLRKSLIFHLQLSILQMMGVLGPVEGKCYEHVSLKYLFLLLLPIHTINLATSEVC